MTEPETLAATPRHAGLHAVLFAAVMLALGALSLERVESYRLTPDRPLIEGQRARDFEAHYDDHFPARTLGVNIWAAIDYVLFDEGHTGVVLGRDGWLYTDEEFAIENDSDAVADANLALMQWIATQLAARQARLLVAIVPAKARVYPEHLDRRLPPTVQAQIYSRAVNALQRLDVPVIGLFPALSAGKATAPTYLQTDTHWTAHGARLAARAIAESVHVQQLASNGDTDFVTIDQPSEPHRGDLLNYLPLDPLFANLLPPPERIARQRTEADPGSTGSADLLGDAGPAPIALVGTSYSANPRWNFVGALKQALRQDVLDYAQDGKGPFVPMLDYLHSPDFATAPPALVIWEVPERYLSARQPLAPYRLPRDVYPDWALAVPGP